MSTAAAHSRDAADADATASPLPLLRFQFVSDVHVEHRADPRAWPAVRRAAGVDTLVVAGDLGRVSGPGYRAFLGRLCGEFARVLLVPGNHEHYQPARGPALTVSGTIDALRAMAAELPGLTVLHGDEAVVGGVRFLGTTLWSHVPDEHRAAVGAALNDYRSVFVARPDGARRPGERRRRKDDGWTRATVADTNAWHAEQLAWLEDAIGRTPRSSCNPAPAPVVVVTHHAPTPAHVAPRYARQASRGLGHAFYTDVTRLVRHPVVCWVSGHTHSSCSMRVGDDGVLCVANCAGYPAERVCGYDPGRVVAVYGGAPRPEAAYGGALRPEAAYGGRAEEEGCPDGFAPV